MSKTKPVEETTNKSFSPLSIFIKEARKELKLSQEDLALRSGVGLRFIRDLEQGRDRNFQIENINQVLLVFGYELRPEPISSDWPKYPTAGAHE